MNDDIRRRLESWGSDPGPDVDPLFAERLEADLRSAAYFSPTPEPEPRKRLMMRPAFVLAGLALVAAVATFAVNFWDDDQGELLVLDDTSASSVIVPGQASMPAEPGVALPDGTIIEVGPEGFAVVSGVVIPPDSRAVVVDGHIELLDPEIAAAPTPTPTPTQAATVRPPTPAPISSPTSVSTPTLERSRTPTPSDTTRPPAEPTPQPTRAPTSPPAPTPTATPSDIDPTPTSEPTATTTPPPDEPADIAVVLNRTNLGPERAVLTWAPSTTQGIRAWEVRVRRGDTVNTVAILRRRGARELVVQRPDRLRIFYTVVALGAEGEVLAVSNEVRVTAAN